MHNPFRSKSRRLHLAHLFVLVWLAGILIHQAQTLLRYLHAGIGSWVWENLTKMQIFSSGLDYLLFGGVLVLVGMILVYVADARSEQEPSQSMQDLLKCTEAAASGDLSRVPEQEFSGEVGQLAQAVRRLVTVLGRSENLVYHLSTLVESSSDAIISFSLEGTILTWNKGAQRIYGYSAGDVKGKSIAILSPLDQGAAIMGALEGIREGNKVQPFEASHQASNGRTVRAFVRVSAIFDSTRNVIAASFCAQDLTGTTLTQTSTVVRTQQ